MATGTTGPAVNVPLLRHGDHMNRKEFERRWDAMPDLMRAELIEGVVHMPALSIDHGSPHHNLNGVLWYYQAQTPGVEGADNTSIRFDDINMPQPDVVLRVLETHGGRTQISEDRYIEGGPELVVEVARSSKPNDLGAKRRLYLRDGVPEYLVWRVDDGEFDWFVLRGGTYVKREPDNDGIFRSGALPGLWLDPAALIAKDGQRLITVAQLGIGSPEHAAFIRELQQRTSANG